MTSLKFSRRFALSLLASLSATVALALPSTALAASDPNPPSISNVTISATTVTAGSTLHVGYSVDDPDGVRSVTPIVEVLVENDTGDHGISSRLAFSSTGNTTAGFDISTSPSDRPCRYRIIGLGVTDSLGWVTDVYDTTYAEEKGLDCPTFTTDPRGPKPADRVLRVALEQGGRNRCRPPHLLDRLRCRRRSLRFPHTAAGLGEFGRRLLCFVSLLSRRLVYRRV